MLPCMVEQRSVSLTGEVELLKLCGNSCLGTRWKETYLLRSCGYVIC